MNNLVNKSGDLVKDLVKDLVNDCISRQAAISEIMEDIEDRSLHDDPATPEDYAEGYDEGIRNAAAIVLQMPSAQPGWIPCGVAFPEKEGVYLVTDKTAYGEKISMRYWNIHEKDAFWSGYESDVVTAWMPLPKPYQEGGQA